MTKENYGYEILTNRVQFESAINESYSLHKDMENKAKNDHLTDFQKELSGLSGFTDTVDRVVDISSEDKDAIWNVLVNSGKEVYMATKSVGYIDGELFEIKSLRFETVNEITGVFSKALEQNKKLVFFTVVQRETQVDKTFEHSCYYVRYAIL